MAQQRITRDDLEAKFQSLQYDVNTKVLDQKPSLITIGGVVAVVFVLVVFFLGKRAGKKKTTFVEIRRL
jgi:uncharacterized membrane protein YdcZ (DUF606 family)